MMTIHRVLVVSCLSLMAVIAPFQLHGEVYPAGP